MQEPGIPNLTLDVAFEKLCELIVNKRCLNRHKTPDYSGFNGHSIGGFKRNSKGSYYELIVKSVSDDSKFDMDSKNISKILFSLFIMCSEHKLSGMSYWLLSDICNFNPVIAECDPYKEDDLSELKNILKKLIEVYDQTEDPFVVKDTQVVSNNDSNIENENNLQSTNYPDNTRDLVDRHFLEQSINKLMSDLDSRINALNLPVNDPELYLTSERIEQFGSKIKYLFNKKLRYENDVKVLRFHLENNTAPKQLFYQNYPIPFLKHNEKFVSDYNKIIRNTQVATMNLIIEHIEYDINVLENDLKYYKRNLVGCVKDVDVFVQNIHDRESEFLKDEFLKSDAKCKRIFIKPFEPEKKKFGVNNNRLNSSYNQNKPKNFNHMNVEKTSSKFDTNDEYSEQEFSDFNLDGILFNTVKKTRFQIINYNPINITINSIEKSKTFNSTYKDIEINLKLELICYNVESVRIQKKK
ncbi:unnamed protein product [Brachionus calyciflorus]|uniref:Uncharacterized protein n=1 Tax=Brachionus calyciflorus TaxID=104777 RepID=A0A814EFD2_9BILA|nr:unnamed protein product [Brachionus calyciflorus]